MKKILTLTLLILFVFGTLLSAQNPEKTPRQKGKTFQRGPKFEKIIFGISEKDYNSLNLTETQLNQINTLQTNYRNEIMAEMKKNINTKNKIRNKGKTLPKRTDKS